jgi:multidrug efflux pump subunit AcrB
VKLPVYAIRNYQFTLIIVALLTLLGVLSFQTMPRSEDPQFDFPMIIVTVTYPGTSPLDMEKLVTDPIEEEINELEDIKEIKTVIVDGVTIVKVEFDYGVDPDEKYDDVIQAISKICVDVRYRQLPRNALPGRTPGEKVYPGGRGQAGQRNGFS